MTLCLSLPQAGGCDPLALLHSRAEGKAQVFFPGKGPWAAASAQPFSCCPGAGHPQFPVCLVTGPRLWEDRETAEAAVTPKECPAAGPPAGKVFCRQPAEAKGSPSSPLPGQALLPGCDFFNSTFKCLFCFAKIPGPVNTHGYSKIGALVKE